jgi:subtilisin family serine protease
MSRYIQLFRITAILLHCAIQSPELLWAVDLVYVKETHPAKLEGILSRIQKDWVAQGFALAKRTASQNNVTVANDETVPVILIPLPNASSMSIDENALIALGCSVLSRSQHLLYVSVPIPSLSDVAKIPGVGFVRRPYKPLVNRIQSEGSSLIQAQTFYGGGFTGKGIKVGIIDLGFEGAQGLQGQGELPISGYRDFTGTGIFSDEIHGTACAEIVHDVAPDAEIYLYKVRNLVDLENAKDAALQDGLDIVSVSLAWSGGGIGDGNGIGCEIVNDAAANGLLWVNAAGNYGQSQYSSLMSDSNANGFHDFSERIEILGLENVKVGQEIELWLTWNDWPLTTTNYDLVLYRIFPDGSVQNVGRADSGQFFEPPEERLNYIVDEAGVYGFAIFKAPGSKSSLFKVLSSNHHIEQFTSIRGNISIPGDATGSLTVGAIDFNKWETGPVEDFSSRGPTFDNRIKPDIVAPDGVSTISYGPLGFPGTSAAAPHVAGAAALIKSSNPNQYTAPKLKEALMASAIDMGQVGKDNVYGAGRLAIASLLSGTPKLTLSTSQLDFGSLRVGDERSLFFNVSNDGQAALIVENLILPSNSFQVSVATFSLSPQKSRSIAIVFRPTVASTLDGDLSIQTNAPRSPVSTIRLLGIGTKNAPIPKPQIVTDLAGIDFGEIEVGAATTQVLLIENHGDAPLEISNIDSPDPQVRVFPSHITISSRESRALNVIFSPTRTGSLHTLIRVTNNDVKDSDLSIPVTGKAVGSENSFNLSVQVGLVKSAQSYTVNGTNEISLEILGSNIRGSIGFSAQFLFDDSQLSFERFEMGKDIPDSRTPGTYFLDDKTGIEVTAASFTNTIPVESGTLGTVWFRPKEGFVETTVSLVFGRLRRDDKFEFSNTPIDIVLAGGNETGPIALPTGNRGVIALDLDLQVGDQGLVQTREVPTVGDLVTVDVIVAEGAFGQAGFEVTMIFDSRQMELQGFSPLDVFDGGIAIISSDVGRATISVAIFGGVSSKDTGSIGAAEFKILEGFTGEAKIGLSAAQFATGNIDIGSGGAYVVIGGSVIEPAFPTDAVERADFSGDNVVNFADFITFAGAFGKSSSDSDFEPRVDLNDDGKVNFPDFIIFAGVFGKKKEG